MDDQRVRDAYAGRAQDYIAAFGAVESQHPQDVERLLAWAQRIDGPVLDVGCGPGVLTGHLAEAGVDAAGIDLVPAFIEHARRSHPTVAFRVGSMADLEVADGSLGGVLAWYSLIHLGPEQLAPVLTGFHRTLRAGGGLAIGFFASETLELFAHTVVDAYRWPPDLMSATLRDAGFAEQARWTRSGTGGHRPHAALLATRA